VKKTLLGGLGALLNLVANILISSSPVATSVLKSLNILSYIKVECKYRIKTMREIVGRWREGGDTGEDIAEEPTHVTDVKIELRQNPLHIDDKDERKSSKSERNCVKSDKDEKVIERLAQYMNPGVNPGVKKANAKNANQKKRNTTKVPLKRRRRVLDITHYKPKSRCRQRISNTRRRKLPRRVGRKVNKLTFYFANQKDYHNLT